MVPLLAVSLLALIVPAIHGQKWTKVADQTDADKALYVTAGADPKLYEAFKITDKGHLKGLNTTTQKWVHIIDEIEYYDMGNDNTAWAIKKDGSPIRIVYSPFGTPAFGSPPSFPDKKLVELSPLSFEKVVGVDKSNKIWRLDTTAEKASWVQVEGDASWVSVDFDFGGVWGVDSKHSVNYNQDYEHKGKWVSKPGVARNIDAMLTNDSNPLIITTSPTDEIYMYSGKAYKPDHAGQVWTKVKGLLAKYCSINDVTLFCVGTNGTIYQTETPALTASLPKLGGAKADTAKKSK